MILAYQFGRKGAMQMTQAVVDYGTEEEAMQAYFRDGVERARALGIRGPLRFDADGRLHPDIVDAYRRHGFYILAGVYSAGEVAEVRKELHDLLERFPTGSESKVDRHGRPAATTELPRPVIFWTKPLGDPLGGTGATQGRASVKMIEPEAASDAPKEVPMLMIGSLQYSDAALSAAGHPGLLTVAATLNGDDFVPFSEALIIKQPGQGGSFAWHQDGTTYWDRPDFDQDKHGINMMVQLYPCTAANTVWVVPGTHRSRADIKKMVDEAGSNRLPDAIPAICEPGDVCISNRQVLHGSFPNTSQDWRMTLIVGVHRRSSVDGVETHRPNGDPVKYDSERVDRRAEMISYAIAARRQRYPDEKPFVYRPDVEAGRTFVLDDKARERIFDYQSRDLFI